MLDLDVVSKLRLAMQKVDADAIDKNLRLRWVDTVQKRELFTKMQEGIPYSRTSDQRAFANTAYDVVSVIGPHLAKASPIDADRVIKNQSMGPLIIELLSDPVEPLV
jgi:hypothetical protein